MKVHGSFLFQRRWSLSIISIMVIKKFAIGIREVELIAYIHDDLTPFCKSSYRYRPAIVICPGGAYEHLSPREEDPAALPLFSAGFQTFILRYTVGRENILISDPEKELADSVSFIKEHAEDLDVIKENIAVLGFSAGGHLAASLCCHWKRYGEESRPDCGILCYPVITMGSYCHERSRDAITNGDKDRLEYCSLEKQVSSDTAPCFIWHTTEDQSVCIMNSLLFVEALTRNSIPYEYHVYQKGGHGLSLGRNETGVENKGVQSWIGLCIDWLYRRWEFSL